MTRSIFEVLIVGVGLAIAPAAYAEQCNRSLAASKHTSS
jgi:hypothetical protein